MAKEKFSKRVIDCFKRAEAGNVEAQYQLGKAFYSGMPEDGILKNDACAKYWYHCAAENNHAPSLHALGAIFYQEKDFVKARDLWQQAANQDYPKSIYNIGIMHLKGRGGLEKDPNKARQCFSAAAKLGHDKAQFELGVIYYEEKGRGLLKAQYWLQKAVDQGHQKASDFLIGIEPKIDHYRQELCVAAQLGDDKAQFELGGIYYQQKGEGLLHAQYWLQKAVDQGHQKALGFLSDIEPEIEHYLQHQRGGDEVDIGESPLSSRAPTPTSPKKSPIPTARAADENNSSSDRRTRLLEEAEKRLFGSTYTRKDILNRGGDPTGKHYTVYNMSSGLPPR